QVKEAQFEYLTTTGQFLSINPEALIVADKIYCSLENFRAMVKDITTVEDLSKLVLIENLTELITRLDVKKKLFDQFKERGLEEGAVLNSLISVTNTDLADQNFFDRIKNYEKIIMLRKKAATEITGNLKQIKESKTNYSAVANKINSRILEEFGRIIPPFEEPTDEKSFKKFTKTLIDKVLTPKYELNYEDKDFKKGKAIVILDCEQKKGTIGKVKGKCTTHKNSIMFFKENAGETCVPENNLVKLETLLDKLIPVEGKPKIGDLIVMTDGDYEYSKKGSWGYIKDIGENHARIEFHSLSGKREHNLPVTWTDIHVKDFKKAEFNPKKKNVVERNYLIKGDIVNLRKESEFAAQNKGEGKITDVDPFNEELNYLVEFKDGYKNNYGEKDLE
ncbi:MAG: hypothetical protein Q8O84_04090, partial [Nanoarchaeota archaeon]|nr:hypothetical protein [Nanoarchaeota archaeon]